eukprot:2701808-Rhodomonas_salina.1
MHISLRMRYAMCGTDIAYAAIRLLLRACCVRCPVLTEAMRVPGRRRCPLRQGLGGWEGGHAYYPGTTTTACRTTILLRAVLSCCHSPYYLTTTCSTTILVRAVAFHATTGPHCAPYCRTAIPSRAVLHLVLPHCCSFPYVLSVPPYCCVLYQHTAVLPFGHSTTHSGTDQDGNVGLGGARGRVGAERSTTRGRSRGRELTGQSHTRPIYLRLYLYSFYSNVTRWRGGTAGPGLLDGGEWRRGSRAESVRERGGGGGGGRGDEGYVVLQERRPHWPV